MGRSGIGRSHQDKGLRITFLESRVRTGERVWSADQMAFRGIHCVPGFGSCDPRSNMEGRGTPHKRSPIADAWGSHRRPLVSAEPLTLDSVLQGERASRSVGRRTADFFFSIDNLLPPTVGRLSVICTSLCCGWR